MGDLYDDFRDLLQETPKFEDALRAWRDRNARAAVRRKLERDRQQGLDDAIDWCVRRRRKKDSGSA